MPNYSFECPNCGKQIDHFCSIADMPEKIPCDNCTGVDCTRVLSAPGMIRVKFDKNGYVGYKIDMGNEKKLYRSATRENYEHQMGNTPSKDVNARKAAKDVLTKDYQAVVDKNNKLKAQKFISNYKKKMGG